MSVNNEGIIILSIFSLILKFTDILLNLIAIFGTDTFGWNTGMMSLNVNNMFSYFWNNSSITFSLFLSVLLRTELMNKTGYHILYQYNIF